MYFSIKNNSVNQNFMGKKILKNSKNKKRQEKKRKKAKEGVIKKNLLVNKYWLMINNKI